MREHEEVSAGTGARAPRAFLRSDAPRVELNGATPAPVDLRAGIYARLPSSAAS